jgi:hypothetical protein
VNPVVAFIARDLAGWLGIPTGIVVATLVVLRKQDKQLRARRQQTRAARRPPRE